MSANAPQARHLNLARGYGLAVLATALAALLRWGLRGIVGETMPFITFFPVVALAAIVGGAGPGILATGLSTLAALVWFIEPSGSLGLTHAGEAAGAGLFCAGGLLVSMVAEMLRGARQREHAARLRQLDAEAQRQHEQARLEGAERFRTMVQAVPSLTFEGDAEGRNTFASDQWCAYTGMTAEETAGWGWARALHPADAEAAKAGWVAATRAGLPVESKHRLRAGDGSYRWFLFRALPAHDDRGRITRWAGSLTDIDDLVRTEETLRASEEFSRRLFNSSHDCIKVLDLEGNLLSMNEGGRRLLEIEDDQPYLNRPYLNFWNEEDWPLVTAALDAARAGAVGRFEGCSRSAKGTMRWWDSRITSIRGADGRPERLLVIARDITEQKKAELALRNALDRLDRHQANSPLGIVEWSGDYRIVAWNPAAERIFGWRAAETLGRHLDDLPLVHEEDWPGVRQIMEDMREGRQSSNIHRNRNWRKDRSVAECEWHNSALYDAEGRLRSVLSLVADVTERNRIERELAAAKVNAERAMAIAEEANRAKDHFLAVLSHELRTPLTPVLAAVSVLLEHSRGDPDGRETAELIRRNVELEARLIDDLLDVTRISRGKIELRKRPVKLAEVIRRAVEVCAPDMEARQLNFSMDLGPAEECIIMADASRLQQVFWNLLRNAVKFTPHGGRVWIQCRLSGDDPSSPPSAIIEVNDSGIGIEPPDLGRIFNAFEQADRAVTRQFGGLGLGLAISKALVEVHGGSITAHSEGKNQGATFRVELPLAAASAPMTGEPVVPAASHAAVRPVRILLVEDHGDTARIMQRLLMADGHQVEIAGDVAAALELAGAEPFDLIISDLGLPDGSGHDLLRQLRSRGAAFPAIALSGFGQEQDVARSIDAGFAAHLTKPVSLPQLEEIIASVDVRPADAGTMPAR